MTISLLTLLPVLPALPLISEDFRSRKVSLLWLIVLAAASATSAIVVLGFNEAAGNAFFNLLLLLYMAGGVSLWILLKNRRLRRGAEAELSVSLKDSVGLGDVMFFAAITPLCGLRGYLLFVLVTLIGSLLWWLGYRVVRRANTTVPLVGTAGIALSLYLIISMI